MAKVNLKDLKSRSKMAKGGLTKIEQEKISSLDETQKKNLSNEIDNEIGKVNDMDFYELSNGNKVKANSLMKKAYHDARKKAFAKFGIKYMAEGGDIYSGKDIKITIPKMGKFDEQKVVAVYDKENFIFKIYDKDKKRVLTKMSGVNFESNLMNGSYKMDGYMAKGGETKVAKFKVEDMVYSYQNKDYAAPINYVKFNPWDSNSGTHPNDTYKYRLSLKDGHSNWIDEKSLYKTKQKEYAKGGEVNEQEMIDKLEEQFKGKDLWEDEILDEYEVKMFDWEEFNDEEVFNKWKRSKEKKNYIVPFESDDDSYIFILVPKNKKEYGGMMEEGGKIKNQYEGKTAKEIWEEWTKDQKLHFLYDHKDQFTKPGENAGAFKLAKEAYDDLPKFVKRALEEHVEDGEYAKGGEIEEGSIVLAKSSYGGQSGVVKEINGNFAIVKHDDGTSASYHISDLMTVIDEEIDENAYADGGEVQIIETKFNSHKNHNPYADILEGKIDKDSFITYYVYVKGDEIGKEGMEYYVGSNYVVGSSKKSSSRRYDADKIPSKYKKAWDRLKSEYNEKHKDSMADGGSIEEQNNEMLQSNMKEIKHHVDELKNIVKDNTLVPAWVLAKIERSSIDLSDITHYLDGRSEDEVESDTYFADGGETDSYSYAKLSGKESQDWEKEAKEYAGKEWDYLSNEEKEELISFLKEGWNKNYNYAKGGKVLMEIDTHKAVKDGDKIKIYMKDFDFEHNKPGKDELLYTIPAENEDDLLPIFEGFKEENKHLMAEANKEMQDMLAGMSKEELEDFKKYQEQLRSEGYKHGGMTEKDKRIADHIIKTYNMDEPGMALVYANQLRREENRLNKTYGSSWRKTMTPADKVNKFLNAVRIADNSIQLKDLTVEASPRGNWVVYEHGKVIMTLNHDMLDEETIRTYNLEHHN